LPKRSNEFQHLILLIEKALRPQGANVTESKELLDHILSEEREVDIVIEFVDGIHPVTIGVECKGGGKKPGRATVEWVEQMWGKHMTLPTDKLILVAKAGFTSSAEKKAAFLNIETLSLSQAENSDWTSVIHKLNSINVVNFLLPYATRATVVLCIGPNEDEVDMTKIDLQNSMLYDAAGSKTSTPQILVERWLNDPALLREIEKLAYTDSGTIIEFERNLKPGVCLVDDTGKKRSVVAIKVEAKCKKEVTTVEMSQGSYGEAALSYGKARFFRKSMQFLAVQQPDDDPHLIVSVKQPKSNK